MGKNGHVDYRSAGRHNSNVSRKPPFALRCNDRVITTKNTFRICKWSCSVCGCAVTRIQTIHRVVEINEPDSVRIPWYQTLGCDVCTYSASRDAHLRAFQKALELEPDYAWAHNGLGVVYS